MQPVKASAVDPRPWLNQFQEVAPRRGFRVEKFGEIEGFPLLALTKRTRGPRPRIYLSAGIHGDEPAGSATLLQLLDENFFQTQANWFVCPLLNPSGLSRGTRESGAGVDLNRDYRSTKTPEVSAHLAWLNAQPRFDVAVCLHEDWEFPGFYIYEVDTTRRPSFAETLIENVAKVCPIEMREVIDEREAKKGIIRPTISPQERELWPEALYLGEHHTDLCFTTESPSSQPLPLRIAAHKTALHVVVAQLQQVFAAKVR